MKKTVRHFFLIFGFVLATTCLQALECTGACPSGCSSWGMVYEVDNDCKVIQFSSVHLYPDGSMSFMTQSSNPEFLGMDAEALGCSCGGPIQ